MHARAAGSWSVRCSGGDAIRHHVRNLGIWISRLPAFGVAVCIFSHSHFPFGKTSLCGFRCHISDAGSVFAALVAYCEGNGNLLLRPWMGRQISSLSGKSDTKCKAAERRDLRGRRSPLDTGHGVLEDQARRSISPAMHTCKMLLDESSIRRW